MCGGGGGGTTVSTTEVEPWEGLSGLLPCRYDESTSSPMEARYTELKDGVMCAPRRARGFGKDFKTFSLHVFSFDVG